VAEKRWPPEEKSAHNGQEAGPRSLKGRESNDGNPETGDAGKKNEKNSDALDTGGAHAVTIGDIPSLERFQVHPNGKSRLKPICLPLSLITAPLNQRGPNFQSSPKIRTS